MIVHIQLFFFHVESVNKQTKEPAEGNVTVEEASLLRESLKQALDEEPRLVTDFSLELQKWATSSEICLKTLSRRDFSALLLLNSHFEMFVESPLESGDKVAVHAVGKKSLCCRDAFSFNKIWVRVFTVMSQSKFCLVKDDMTRYPEIFRASSFWFIHEARVKERSKNLINYEVSLFVLFSVLKKHRVLAGEIPR